MAKIFVSSLMLRLVMPTGLLIAMAIRPYGISIIYLLLYLLHPLVEVPSPGSKTGCARTFHFVNMLVGIILFLLHAVWHTLLIVNPPYGSVVPEYPVTANIAYNLGFVCYKDIDPLYAMRLITPELITTTTGVLSHVLVMVITKAEKQPGQSDGKFQRHPVIVSMGKYISLLFVLSSSVMLPSVTSGIYFLTFIGCATAWALGRSLGRAYAVICRCLMMVMAIHIIGLMAYQSTWIIEMLPPEQPLPRYFGLVRIVILNGTDDQGLVFDPESGQNWSVFVSPLLILVTYFLLALEAREVFKPKKTKTEMDQEGKASFSGKASFFDPRERWLSTRSRSKVALPYISSKAIRGDPSETSPLVRNTSMGRPASIKSISTVKPMQDSTGSVVMPDEDAFGDEQPTIWEDITAAVVTFFQVLVRSSYIATTITMMGWSILYHSWLTFVLLMWANLVWLRENQRSFMLSTSPVLVCYAILLLLAQYIYSMDLTEAELPSNLTSVNLKQIGLQRPEGVACVPLLIKSLFTCVFWLTLRQRMQDSRKRGSVEAGTAMSGADGQRAGAQSRLLRTLGDGVRAACAHYWIYVVVIMLFVIGITGERMTIFRIIYMSLFLIFIFMFQISWYWWRRLLYVFWIILIIYSMINLILIYVYQFDNFSVNIEDYLKINHKLQNDLGLEHYEPANLFVKLLTPTLFLIITIMQVHYFHKDFMALSDPKTSTWMDGDSSKRSHGRTAHRTSNTIRDDIPSLPAEDGSSQERPKSAATDADQSMEMTSLHSGRRSPRMSQPATERPSVDFRSWMGGWFKKVWSYAMESKEKVFLYLDLHLIKIVFLSLMLLCVFNVCAIHVPIMLIISPGLMLKPRSQRVCVLVISALISVYTMAKMMYQIDYIHHSVFDVECTLTEPSSYQENYNNAKWVGFTKITRNASLVHFLRGYIGLIVVFIFYSLVTYRQTSIRKQGVAESIKSSHRVVFPEVTRVEADKDMIHCAKYLVNHAFYKFGVEISLICLLGVIGSRMDVFAVIYSGWLVVLVSVKRPRQAAIWKSFAAFITLVVPIQYMMAVGFIPQLCMEYPWYGSDQQMKQLRSWMFLPYTEEPPQAAKLIFDYLLLLFVSCQLRVFKIERKFGEQFPGGSNSEDTGKDWETADFVNPVPDFLNYIGSWLDILKRMVFLGMLWVTLAIMFMTGTNRVNLFSMGYLIGSFIFLWQGTDFYLRPKSSILRWWSWLLLYNVGVVVVKSLLQIPGCIFSAAMEKHACWLVQLLGIGCVDKFAGGKVSTFIKMEYIKLATCSVPQEDIGLAWDGVCFAFLILQRRLFHSYYFYRVIDESKATTVLASRGAELIEQLRLKQMEMQKGQEVRILEKIKLKMERIKAGQQKVKALSLQDETHDTGDGTGFRPVYSNRHKASTRPSTQEPSSHQKAVRSGDYYMFGQLDEADLPVDDDSSSDEEAPKEMGIGKLLSTAFKTDLRHAVSMRRASMPSRLSSLRASEMSRRSSRGEVRKTEDIQFTDPSEHQTDPNRPASDMVDEMAPPEEETWFQKLSNIFFGVQAFVSSILVSLTRHLMKYSRDYRYVSRALAMEKKVLKEKEGFGIGLREGSQMIWEPLPDALQGTHTTQDTEPAGNHLQVPVEMGRKLSDISVPEIRIVAASVEGGLDAWPVGRSPSPSGADDTSEHESAFSLQSSESKDVTALEEQDESMFNQGKSSLVYVAYATWYAILAHTDIVCYIMVFINQVQSATILSIPLPLMVFLWGTLSVPRPTKTFWVTLIAYTEVIVLIKSMFQFEILPWNQMQIPDKIPFTAPRIIGIERKQNYALYDLLLLLIIFLHRFMLKSLGLWNETPTVGELQEDMEYPLMPEDAKLILEGRREEVGRKYAVLHHQTGPPHRMVDRHHRVKQTILDAMRDLEATRSDPRVLHLASLRLQIADRVRRASRRGHTIDYMEGVGIPSRDSIAGPSQPSDEHADDHYSVNNDEEPIIAVSTRLENVRNYYPQVILLSFKRYLKPTRRFFKRMLMPGARVTADVYAYMFLCDFFNFLVVIFGFAAFGTQQGDGGVQAYLEENKVPIPFLVMLILQFALIIIDRALYLRKFMLGKILFQYALIIGVHIWMFFVLPFITERTFNALLPPPLWYMVKCIYLLLSAYQIRCGYPRRIIGNFLCKSYRFLNMVFFRCFMAVPFVFELRTLMDWIWTDTSMTLMDWLKMEDIFASVFLLKCSRYVENEFPQPRGAKKSTRVKYLLGGAVLAFIIAIIWFPLVFFAFGNTVGTPNPPTDVTMKIRIGPYLPIYQMTAQSNNVAVFTEQDFALLSNIYARDRTAQTFLSNYMYNDIAVVTINANSTMNWQISPPELQRLEAEATSNASLTVKLTYVLTHPSNAVQNPPTIEDSREVLLEGLVDNHPNPERVKLQDMLNGTAPVDTWITIKELFPKFVKVFNKGTAKPAFQLMNSVESADSDEPLLYRDVQLRLEIDNITKTMYWRVREACETNDQLSAIPLNNCANLVMYTFNDKLFPETLKFISGSGIIGLYTTFVFLASRMLRGFFSGIYTKIMFDDLPNVDRVLQLCLDIYLVREALELELEEDLFAKLVFLYRSPETMIKWTRMKEDNEQSEMRSLPPPRQSP